MDPAGPGRNTQPAGLSHHAFSPSAECEHCAYIWFSKQATHRCSIPSCCGDELPATLSPLLTPCHGFWPLLPLLNQPGTPPSPRPAPLTITTHPLPSQDYACEGHERNIERKRRWTIRWNLGESLESFELFCSRFE